MTFCGDGGARERADGLLSCRRQKNKSEQRPFCSDVSRGSEKRCGFDASDETKEKAEPGTPIASRFSLVPVAGLEPARYRYRWILSYLLHTEYKRTQTPMEVVNGHLKARNY